MQPYNKTITPTPIITVKAFIIWFLINAIWQALEVCYEGGIQKSASDTVISVILLGFILTCLYFKERIDVLKQQLTANYPDNNGKPTMHIHIQAPVSTAKYAAKTLIKATPEMQLGKVTGTRKCCNIYLSMCIDGLKPDESEHI